MFDAAGSAAFPGSEDKALFLAGFLNSKVAAQALGAINPTVNFQAWNIGNLPLNTNLIESIKLKRSLKFLHDFSELDWNSWEISWDFECLPLLTMFSETVSNLESSYSIWIAQSQNTIAEMKRLEEENNRLFIDAYGLQDELTPEVPIEQITLTVNPAHRYGIKGTEEEGNTRFREDTMDELISYAIGCMMGRYSLDAPGLIYANSGNEGFDASQYTTFPADDDGIIPLTDAEWFADDAANRVEEFISVAWPANSETGNHLEENLDFLAANLSPKKSESSRDTIRRYLCDKFYKDHMQTYKKRELTAA